MTKDNDPVSTRACTVACTTKLVDSNKIVAIASDAIRRKLENFLEAGCWPVFEMWETRMCNELIIQHRHQKAITVAINLFIPLPLDCDGRVSKIASTSVIPGNRIFLHICLRSASAKFVSPFFFWPPDSLSLLRRDQGHPTGSTKSFPLSPKAHSC